MALSKPTSVRWVKAEQAVMVIDAGHDVIDAGHDIIDAGHDVIDPGH